MANEQSEINLNEWNPMVDDYCDPDFNSYSDGPGKYMRNVVPDMKNNVTVDQRRPPLQKTLGNTSSSSRYDEETGCTLYVTGIPVDMTEDGLVNLFSQCGTVSKVTKKGDQGNYHQTCYGFVEYLDPMSACSALEKFKDFRIGSYSLRARMKRTTAEKERINQNRTLNPYNATGLNN